MSSAIETLPQPVLIAICHYLEQEDVLYLASSSKTLWKVANDQEVWKSKTLNDFGDLFTVYLLLNSAGLELGLDLDSRYAVEPQDWAAYYRAKSSAARDRDENERLQDAEISFVQVQALLRDCQENKDLGALAKVAVKMVGILESFPSHAGCYHLLGFVLFVLNRLEDALLLLEMGRNIDPEYEPIDELEEEIQTILIGYEGAEDEVPLLQDSALTPRLREVLSAIFDVFDLDHDAALSPAELDEFVFCTNGSHPPRAFLTQMGQRFGANRRGWLTKEGFFEFFLEQTLDDPSETRRDLGVHGYDGRTLVKLDGAEAEAER